MSVLSREARFVQNPALGATLIWRFAVGYATSHPTGESPALPAAFVILPLILHDDTRDVLKGTRRNSGLLAFAEKFSRSEVGKADVLLSLNSRALQMRSLTIRSIQLCIRHRLVTLSAFDAQLLPLTTTPASHVAASVRPMIESAEKLGNWFSQLTLYEIAATLKVSF